MQKYAILKIMFFIEVLYQIEVQLVINWSSRLQKTPNTKILTKIDFLRIF